MKNSLPFYLLCASLVLGAHSSELWGDEPVDILVQPNEENPQCVIPPSIDISAWNPLVLDLKSSKNALRFLVRTEPEHLVLLLHRAVVNDEAIPADSRFFKVYSPVFQEIDRGRIIRLLDDALEMVSQGDSELNPTAIRHLIQEVFPVEDYDWQSVCAQVRESGGSDKKLVIATGDLACFEMGSSFPDLPDEINTRPLTEVALAPLPDRGALIKFPGGGIIEATGADTAQVYRIVDISHAP